MATYQELRTRSQQVRDEQNIGGNTALRVGQLLMDIVKYFNDNDEAASEYLQQHFAMVNDGTQLLNWQQSPIVILHTMGDDYDDGDFSALSQGENYYRAGFIMEANGQGGGINGETPKANVLYVNLANGTLYTWNGASFDAISSGGGGSISGDDILKNAYYLNGNLVLVFETESGDKTVSIPVNFDASNYVPTSRTVNGKALSNNITLSQSDIPGLVAALAGKISGIKTSNNTPLTPDSNGIVTLPPAGSTISPASAAPIMDGTAAVGSSAKYAREDHVHPHDTSKQDALTFDSTPTASSTNPVTSGGIYTALQNILANITIGQNGNWYIGQTDTNIQAQGPTGNVSISDASDILTYIVNDLTTGGGNNILSAEQGKVLNLMLQAFNEKIQEVVEDGFFVADEDGNVGMQYDEDGFDVALLSEHFIQLLNQAGIGATDIETMQVRQEGLFIVDDNLNIAFSVTPDGINAAGVGTQLEALVGKTYAGQCVVRFLPFLSAWNNASKNSLCLCATKQQIVNNKIPFYDGFLFHKLPTDDKSLWYGTTLDNAVQIGSMSVYPKDYQLAMSPKDGRVIAAIRGNGQQRADLHVWDGTTDTAVAAVSSDGNSRKPLGWLYNCGYDFIKNGNNEYMIFAEYNGDGTNKGGYYVWKGTYPYTSPSNWKTVFHRPYAGKTYGTIAYGTIAHFHMVRRDPWTNILYLAAGDYPTQLIWWYSTDYGETWTELTNNETNGWEQHVARACNMVFTKDYIYWANDHGVNHCLNRVARNAQTGIIDPSTREKLCDLRFGQACNSICYVESPHGLFMYERIDTGDEFSQQYGTPVKMYFWDIDQGKLYEVANVPLLSGQTWGGSRGKCYLNFTSGQQPRPAMGFSDDTRCIFDIAGSDGQNIGTIYYEL